MKSYRVSRWLLAGLSGWLTLAPAVATEGQSFDSGGVPIYYEIVGEGPPVIFLHGFGGRFDRERYGEMLGHLSGFQVIGIDVRGFGRSGKPPATENYGLELVRDIPRLLDHLALTSAHIIGHSMGGFIGLKAAAQYPERVRSLVLAAQGWAAREELEGMASAAYQVSQAPRQSLEQATREAIERLGMHIFAGLTPSYPELFVSRAEISSLRMPILAVIGGEDPRMERATLLRRAHPEAKILVVPGKGHGQEIADPLFGSSVGAFLARVEQNRSPAGTRTRTASQDRLEAIQYQDLRYRLIGPFRASRTVGAVGIPSQPNVFFIGVNNGGVWKSDDYGRTWNPIFDEQPTGSVGDIAVSASHPEIIYVGSGEGLHRPDLGVGDGIFKSTNGGRTWTHVGLGDVQQVGRLIVHPTNPDIVFVAALGHPYGANEVRGVFRTLNGGNSWERVLYLNPNTGAIQVEFDPNDPQVLYADLWEHREGPWENASFSGPHSGLYKSTDGGSNWRLLSTGLPGSEQGLGRIGLGIAPSDSRRLYATVDARQGGGIYRSDNAGESWTLISTDRRLWGRGGDFGEIRVHPNQPDHIYVCNVAFYESVDGGKTWTSTTGAPGGNDYHRLWINPEHPEIMLSATDQGAIVTVNGGRTWGSWLNQPTAQLYHVATDNSFPYWVYGGQQESGAIGIASRGNGGQISIRDWMGIGADEYAYVAPDPLDPNIVYGGRVVRFDKRTGQTQNVAPEALRSGNYRTLRTMPLLFHPADPERLLFATNVLWSTDNGGQDWQIISPDLSRPKPAVPPSIGDFSTPDLEDQPRRGVIYAVGPSPLDVDTIWAGTDDGLVHVTRNGGQSWIDVTPPELQSWEKISQIDAGHHDPETAYIAVNSMRRSDLRAHVFRTHDGGASWQRIVRGLETAGPINVVREDPRQPGLLFVGSERHIYFSVDDGEQWYLLRQNLPPSSMRDLVIRDSDLVVGTHGRSIWILDDIGPLRELKRASGQSAFLFTPQPATRVRDNMFNDTPLSVEEPAGQNPPDGAILDYSLNSLADEVVIEIFDSDGNLVRRFSSRDSLEEIDAGTLAHPTYWIRPPARPQATRGHHRFVWDLRYPPPKGTDREFSIAATYRNTPSGPRGPFVHPGLYRIRLAANGVVAERSLEVRIDPRLSTPTADLRLQTSYSQRCYQGHLRLQAVREAIDSRLGGADLPASLAERLRSFRGSGQPGLPDPTYGSIRETPVQQETVVGLQSKWLFLLEVLQAADARPTDQVMAAVERLATVQEGMLERWREIESGR